MLICLRMYQFYGTFLLYSCVVTTGQLMVVMAYSKSVCHSVSSLSRADIVTVRTTYDSKNKLPITASLSFTIDIFQNF